MQTRVSQRAGGWRFIAALAGLAAVLFVSLAAYLRGLEARARSGASVSEQLTSAGQPRPLAEVARAVQELKLVTVEVDSRVIARTTSESWRGDTGAKVEAPVKLLYGTDLTKMSVHSMSLSPADGGLLVRIPRPERISTEVCGDAESVEVTVGWLRFRSRAGEYYLGLARRDLYRRARELTLSPADARFVRETTRKQTEALVKKVVGDGRPVAVVYEDGGP
jgi:hypothetical protein